MTPEELGYAVVAYLRGWVEVLEAADVVARVIRDQVIEAGSRVIDGGQVGTAPDGRVVIEYRDERTGRVLFHGAIPESSRGWEAYWFNGDSPNAHLPDPHHAADRTLPDSVRGLLDALAPACAALGTAGLRELLDSVTDIGGE